MEKITITEALSQINLINKKIEAKQTKVLQDLVKYEHVPDPYQSQGGSEKMIAEEVQSIRDLQSKLVRIRGAISQANINNKISIGGRERSISDWLTWKREISKKEVQFAFNVYTNIKNALDRQSKQPQVYKPEGKDQPELAKLKVNTDFSYWIKEHEELNDLIENLDGQLSLKNATIFVEV